MRWCLYPQAAEGATSPWGGGLGESPLLPFHGGLTGPGEEQAWSQSLWDGLALQQGARPG